MAMTFWTREEETRLVRELRDGLTVEDIAAAHQRTPNAVLARTSRMAPEDLDLRTRAQRTDWLREQLLTDPDYNWAAQLMATRRRQHDQTRANAPRHGAAWTQAEDEQVLAAADASVSIRDLAGQLQRSTKSTARRIYHLANRDDAASSAEAPAAPSAQDPSNTLVGQAGAVPTAATTAAATTAAATAARTGGPTAHGQPWTEDETLHLLEELRRGEDVEDVAAAHQRSVRAINGRAALVLTQLTGTKYSLREDSAVLLRAHLRSASPATTSALATTSPPTSLSAPTSRPERVASQQDAVAVVCSVLGATVLDA